MEGQMLDLLKERMRPFFAGQILVSEVCLQLFVSEWAQVIAHLLIQLAPTRPELSKSRYLLRFNQRRRGPLPTQQPYELRAVKVHERAIQTLKTRTEVFVNF